MNMKTKLSILLVILTILIIIFAILVALVRTNYDGLVINKVQVKCTDIEAQSINSADSLQA